MHVQQVLLQLYFTGKGAVGGQHQTACTLYSMHSESSIHTIVTRCYRTAATSTVAAAANLQSHLTALRSLSMHLQRPRGLAGQVTLRGLWNLVELSPNLATLNLTGYMETQLLVPGRVPGVGM
jgi:hypothetical protein